MLHVISYVLSILDQIKVIHIVKVRGYCETINPECNIKELFKRNRSP